MLFFFKTNSSFSRFNNVTVSILNFNANCKKKICLLQGSIQYNDRYLFILNDNFNISVSRYLFSLC